MRDFTVRVTEARLYDWRKRWPGSTLVPGYAMFEARTGELVDLGGRLTRANVDVHEFDAFVDQYQSAALRAIRGVRA